MTWFLSVRTAPASSSVVRPFLFEGTTQTALISGHLRSQDDEFARALGARDLVIATHGFNVGATEGMKLLSALETSLALRASSMFLGLLWPGDAAIPVINYPSEAATAVQSGRAVARWCDAALNARCRLSLVSHSLGARVILEAAAAMARSVGTLCLTAAAVDADCLADEQYRAAVANAARVVVIASTGDTVLRLAYPAGDLLADLLLDDRDSPFRRALGLRGAAGRPAVDYRETVHDNAFLARIDHGDYLSSSTPASAKPALIAREIRSTLD